MLLHYFGKLKNHKFALYLHAKRFKCDFLSPIQQISVKCHENKCKITTFSFLFIHCP